MLIKFKSLIKFIKVYNIEQNIFLSTKFQRMGFFTRIKSEIIKTKDRLENMYQKGKDQPDPQTDRFSYRNIDQNKDMLRSTLKFSTYAPLIIESYIILYVIYSFYTILKTIILTPIQLILGITNVILRSLNLYKTKYITMHSLVVALVAYIFTLSEDIFDISFMYHLIRGQSTVKVYAIIFALESSEIVFTKVGVFLHKNIQQKLTSKDLAFYKLIPQFIVQFCYVFTHAYIIYIDFLIYSVVLNSSIQSFIIFWSVVYLTKMKTAPQFGINIIKYKTNLTDDSKYRTSRLIYLFLFQISQFQISISSLGYKFIFIIFVEEAYIIVKHMLYLLSSYKGVTDTSAIAIRQEMYKTMYLDTEKTSIDRCVEENFTVLPFAVFTIKIISVVIYSNWEPNFLAYFTFYIILCFLAGVALLFIILIKSTEEMIHDMRKNKQVSPLLNSLLINNVMGKIIEDIFIQNLNKSKQSNQHQELKQSVVLKRVDSQDLQGLDDSKEKSKTESPKLKRATSFFQSLLIHAKEINNQNKDAKDQIKQQSRQEEGDTSLDEKQIKKEIQQLELKKSLTHW